MIQPFKCMHLTHMQYVDRVQNRRLKCFQPFAFYGWKPNKYGSTTTLSLLFLVLYDAQVHLRQHKSIFIFPLIVFSPSNIVERGQGPITLPSHIRLEDYYINALFIRICKTIYLPLHKVIRSDILSANGPNSDMKSSLLSQSTA